MNPQIFHTLRQAECDMLGPGQVATVGNEVANGTQHSKVYRHVLLGEGIKVSTTF